MEVYAILSTGPNPTTLDVTFFFFGLLFTTTMPEIRFINNLQAKDVAMFLT